jgi:GTPase SAR1 family protein
MVTRFGDLWNALSKPGVLERRLEQRLLGHTQPQIPPKLAASVPGYPGAKARNRFQTDLKIVSELVLEDVATAPDLEAEFLRECYIESGTLSEFSLLSRDLLRARYSALFGDEFAVPTTEPAVTRGGVSADLLAKSLSRRPILILGDVGVGKTTFLRHLLNVSAAEQMEKAIALHLNLGNQAALAMDLRTFVVEEMMRQLREQYDIDVEEYGLVRATYHGELQRFARGIYGRLAEADPARYQQKELEFMEAKLADRAEHLKHALEHVQKGRKQQIVILLDNADQRDYDTQQQAFLIAQEFAATWPATVFVTLRPETFHLSLRSGGTLSGYHPKAFTIAPPRIDRVIEKRLHFGLRLTRGEIPIQALQEVNVQLHSLDMILRALLDTLESSRDVGELIDNIAGGNVRLALDLVQGFLGSGHVDTEKIVSIYSRNQSYRVPLHEFLRAVIYGDSAHYDPTRSYVANLFDLSSIDPKEHFLLPLLLSQLSRWTGPGIENGFVEASALYERLQGMGFTPEQIDSALARGTRHRLVETAARRPIEPGHELPAAFRITSVGVYHGQRLASMFAYVDAVIVDTPILDRRYRELTHDVPTLAERFARARLFCEYLDEQWQTTPESAGPFQWPQASATIRREVDRIEEIQIRRGYLPRPPQLE